MIGFICGMLVGFFAGWLTRVWVSEFQARQAVQPLVEELRLLLLDPSERWITYSESILANHRLKIELWIHSGPDFLRYVGARRSTFTRHEQAVLWAAVQVARHHELQRKTGALPPPEVIREAAS